MDFGGQDRPQSEGSRHKRSQNQITAGLPALRNNPGLGQCVIVQSVRECKKKWCRSQNCRYWRRDPFRHRSPLTALRRTAHTAHCSLYTDRSPEARSEILERRDTVTGGAAAGDVIDTHEITRHMWKGNQYHVHSCDTWSLMETCGRVA